MASRRAFRSQLKADPTSRLQKFCVAALSELCDRWARLPTQWDKGEHAERHPAFLERTSDAALVVTEQGEP
jgi:hypothetical protein